MNETRERVVPLARGGVVSEQVTLVFQPLWHKFKEAKERLDQIEADIAAGRLVRIDAVQTDIEAELFSNGKALADAVALEFQRKPLTPGLANIAAAFRSTDSWRG
jgi:hypothetical protein